MKLIILLAAFLALWPVASPAYVLGPRWESLPVTYVTDPGLEAETAAAISRWSAVSGFRAVPGVDGQGWEGAQIEVRLAYPDNREYGGVALLWHDGTFFQHCVINVNPDRWAADYPGDRMTILTHEMGHCLGLRHSDVYLSMMGEGYVFSIDDALGARALYGPSPNRMVVPNISKPEEQAW